MATVSGDCEVICLSSDYERLVYNYEESSDPSLIKFISLIHLSDIEPVSLKKLSVQKRTFSFRRPDMR